MRKASFLGMAVSMLVVSLLAAVCVSAQDPLPVLYGQVTWEGLPADGAVVKAYPQMNPGDFLFDTVGPAGSTAVSGYWKIVMNNFQFEPLDGDVVIVEAVQGDRTASSQIIVDRSRGTYQLNLALQAPPPSGNPVSIQIFAGWNLIGLPFKAPGVDDAEQLAQAIIASGNELFCDVVLHFNGADQLFEADITGLADPSFLILGTEGYYVHCDGATVWEYDGEPW